MLADVSPALVLMKRVPALAAWPSFLPEHTAAMPLPPHLSNFSSHEWPPSWLRRTLLIT